MSKQLPDITSEAEEGFVDLVFAITEYVDNPDGTKLFRAEAVHNENPLGIEIMLGPDWKAGTIGENIPSYSGIVTYRTLGAGSDQLVRLLDQLYGTNLSPSSMKQNIVFDGITLHGDPNQIQEDVLKIKLFFIPEEEEGYAEIYTNINVSEGKLEIREKDEDYRFPVIKALSTFDA